MTVIGATNTVTPLSPQFSFDVKSESGYLTPEPTEAVDAFTGDHPVKIAVNG
ncbi:hypothetical protein [Streptomyces sp. NPDC046887]|uniref:hypothetical protein n=1 Tax=Streptomyces sp. NPDC046887 TaxID=3155472 RepID=UPI0034029DDF